MKTFLIILIGLFIITANYGQDIIYIPNGAKFKQGERILNNWELNYQLKMVPKAYEAYQLYRQEVTRNTLYFAGSTLTLFAGLGTTIYGIALSVSGETEHSDTIAALGLGTTVTAVVLFIFSGYPKKDNLNKALKLYNDSGIGSTSHLNFSLKNNGLGLVYNF